MHSVYKLSRDTTVTVSQGWGKHKNDGEAMGVNHTQ